MLNRSFFLHRILAVFGLVFGLFFTTGVDAQYSDFPDPVGYWSFDRCDGADTWDAAVNPHHAKLYNGAACSYGRYGSGGWFDGNDNLVEVQGSESIDLDRLTISAWIYPFSTNGFRTIANKWYVLDQWSLAIINGQLTFTVAFPGGAWGVPVNISYPATANRWSHVTGTYDGSTMRLYVDGVQRASVNASGLLQNSSRKIAIGNHPSGNAFHGYIDEVKLYDSALSSTNVARLATAPSSNGLRGVHLMPSQWTCVANQTYCDSGIVSLFDKDLGIIHSIGNLNSIKTSIFTMEGLGGGQSFWEDRQKEKLTYLKSATGNHKTWILRAWPVENSDPYCTTGGNYYQCGRNLARNLIDVFGHIQNTLKLQHVYIEPGNEPNIETETLFYDASPAVTMGRYNDFFRGFYYGQQEIGYSFPLTYAGLSPQCSGFGACGADAWYQDYWVRWHIQNFAAKVGVHTYWDSTNGSAWNSLYQQEGGLYHRRVKNLLASGSYSPAVSPRGLQMTEFNFNRATGGHSHQTQANQICSWFQQAASDAASGWWIEQSTIFITRTEDGTFQNEYWLQDSQLDEVRNCN